MDVTPLFKACVKTVRTRNKAFGVQNDADKNRILKNKPKNIFIVRAKDITSQITRFRDFLLENRSAYLHFSKFMNSREDMTDVERDQIDKGSQKIVNTCMHEIQEFKKETRKYKGNPQVLEFMDNVLKIMEDYLKKVCAIHSEQKALRVKRALDLRKLTKLEIEKKPPLERKRSSEIMDELLGNTNRTVDSDVKENNTVNNKNTVAIATEMDTSTVSEDDQLSAEEMQMFESENLQLYNELNSLSEEVKQIESKVLHIAELQEVFTEKVEVLFFLIPFILIVTQPDKLILYSRYYNKNRTSIELLEL